MHSGNAYTKMSYLVVDLSSAVVLGNYNTVKKATRTADKAGCDYAILHSADDLRKLTAADRLRLWQIYGLCKPHRFSAHLLYKQLTEEPMQTQEVTKGNGKEPPKRTRRRKLSTAKRAQLENFKPLKNEKIGAFIGRILTAQEQGRLNPSTDQAIADHVRTMLGSKTGTSMIAHVRKQLRNEGIEIRTYKDLAQQFVF